jgi:type VI secretion system protein VasJ
VANLQDIAALGTTPIPGDSPTGASARYEPEYEKVQAEIEKLQSVSQTPVLWGEVVSLSSTLLSTKSKDLLLGSYVTAGLLAEDGYPGLAAGLNFYKDLIATFWDKLFPPIEKMRAREGAARWLDERGARMLSEITASPGESDRESLTACLAAVEAVNALMGEKFTDQPIGLSELKGKIEEKLYSIPEPQAAAPADGGGGESGSAEVASGGEAAPPPPPAEIDSPERAREAIQKSLDYLRGANASDPFAWQIHRILLWSPITELPEPMPAGGDAALAASWDQALKKKDYQRVLDEAEARLATEPLWLDLNLYSVRAMEGLGDAYEKARLALAGQVAALVRRIPELPSAVFEGGVPAAGEVTRQWIDHELLGAASKNGTTGGAERMDGTMAEARKLATRGKLPAATAMVQKELETVPPGRSRFLWRLNLARLCADSGKPLFAVPQLEALDAEAERGGLEQWEPELAVEVVKLLWQCYSSLSKTGGETMADKASRAYSRLCRLDLTTAMALDGKK